MNAIPSASPLPSFVPSADEFVEEPVQSEAIPRLPSARSRTPVAPTSAHVRPRLPESPGILAWLARRFQPGEATIWLGPSSAVTPLLELVYAGSASVEGEISLIEGANRFHPFRIGELGRDFGVPPEEVLRRIRLARAFTAHQLVALVDGWSIEARRRRPTLLVAHELPTLFETAEIRSEERDALLRHVARTLRTVIDRAPYPLLVALEGGFDRFPGLLETGPRFADLITFRRHPRGLALRAYRDDARVRLVRRRDGQRGMEEFADDRTEEPEVIPWAAPHPPTVRHWTSG
ncbi:MAG: hypothetical protein LVQ64_04120 [Thermoplasmatales archaeon]|nr:hypothetical protein [Thermoplasmatales archaeon]